MITAGYDLGANNRQILKDIILPYLSPGIIAGYFMAFTYSLDDFAVTFFVTGNGFTTLSVEIYSRARRGVSLEINALSTLVFLFALSYKCLKLWHLTSQSSVRAKLSLKRATQ